MASVIALAASAMLAQEVGYLDLTDPSPRLNTRTAGHFIGGSCNADEPTARPETTITLMRLDSLGKEITFEARIVNSGKETVEIPWIAHLGDLEPLDPKQPYLYRNAAFVLELTVPD